MKKEAKSPEGGIAMVGAVVVLPAILLIGMAIFDLSRLYLTALFAQEVALLTAKIANSDDPAGYSFEDDDLTRLIKSAAGESDAIIAKRQAFLSGQINPVSPLYYGLPFFSAKDKEVLNLAYGFASELSPKVLFPVPYPLNESNPNEDLQNRVNCSIYISFPSGHEPPSPFPDSTDASYNSTLRQDRDRVIHVDCVVPVMGMRLLGIGGFQDYRTVNRTSYAPDSGGLQR